MSSAVRHSAQEPTEGSTLYQRSPVGIHVIYGGEDVKSSTHLEYHQQASAKIIEGLAEKYEKQKTN